MSLAALVWTFLAKAILQLKHSTGKTVAKHGKAWQSMLYKSDSLGILIGRCQWMSVVHHGAPWRTSLEFKQNSLHRGVAQVLSLCTKLSEPGNKYTILHNVKRRPPNIPHSCFLSAPATPGHNMNNSFPIHCLAQGALFGSKELLSLSFAARLSLMVSGAGW